MMVTRWIHGVAWGAIALALLGGCASKDRLPPAPLQQIKPQIAGKQVWHASLSDKVRFPLAIASAKGKFFAADDGGHVVVLEASSGRELWHARVGDDLSAGVGSDGRWASVVTRGNELVTLEEGSERWRAKLGIQVVTAPLVAGERVFVVGVDRSVQAFDAATGRLLWVMRRPGDALTLGQASVLTAYKDTLLVGQGNRLAGLDPLKGTVRWEATVAMPRGTNEIERLSDLVGPAGRVGGTFCARAYQTAVGCVDAERGSTLWNVNTTGSMGVAADGDAVYATDAADRVTARRRSDGVSLWSNERLLNRRLSAPVVVGPTVVFADLDGQVHFLSRSSGDILLRLPTDGSPVVAAPALSDTTLLVVTEDGGLFAFRPE